MPAPADRVKAAFMAALEVDSAQRAAVLDEMCAGDAEVRRRVEAMLHVNDRTDLLLDQPAACHLATATNVADAKPSPADELPGTLIAGRYRLRDVIGEGGMGTVWVAEQTDPVRRTVAIKLIKPGMDSRQVIARFEAERQALAVMDHPHIAKVLDGGTTETGRPFFVMDYVPGRPITEFCDAERVDVAGRLRLFVQVCEAVQHAHQKGVIHRDLKPSNVLVQTSGAGPVPKVIDFGLAKVVGDRLSETSLQTALGMLLGTLQYMSPEQADLGNPDIDTRADVYALGVILYELLTGTTPIDRQSLNRGAWLEALRLIREEEPPRPSARLNDSGSLPSVAAQRSLEPVRLTKLLRGDLDWIVMKALEKERSRRYDSATGFAADVQRYLIGDAVQAVPPSAGYRLRKFLRRHRGPVAAIALVLVVLVGGIVATTLAMMRAQDAEKRAKSEEQKTAGERDQKEAARAAEQARRIEAEVIYASQMIDQTMAQLQKDEAFGYGGPLGLEPPNSRRIMLGLAALLDRLPASARDAREFVTMMVLYPGQTLHSLWPTQATAEDLGVRVIPGTDLAVCEGADNVFRVRDLFTGREVRRIRPAGEVDAAWPSRDGRTLVVGLRSGGRTRPVALYDLATGAPAGGFVEPLPWPGDWSTNGRHAVTDEWVFAPLLRELFPLTQTARLLDGNTGKTVASYPGYEALKVAAPFTVFHQQTPVVGMFSPDGRLALLLPTSDGPAPLVATDNGRVVARIRGVAGQFTPTGRHVVMETDTEFLWYRCADGQPAGIARRPGLPRERDGYEHNRVFDAYVLHGQSILRPDGRSIELGAAALAYDGEPTKLAQEPPGQTLQATALVHEANIRLVDSEDEQKWKHRGHFFDFCEARFRIKSHFNCVQDSELVRDAHRGHRFLPHDNPSHVLDSSPQRSARCRSSPGSRS
jgi:hypothetical protein